MRRFYGYILMVCLGLLAIACRALSPVVSVLPSATPPPGIASSATPVAALPPQTMPDATQPGIVAQPAVGLQVRFHPDGGLYVGDQVSLEVIAPVDTDLDGKRVRVSLLQAEGETLIGTADFGRFGIAARSQATLFWAWDTSQLQPAEYTLHFVLQPEGVAWNEKVTLLPGAQLDPRLRQAHWVTAESECCLVYYVSGTEAERDLDSLLSMLDQQAEDVVRRMQVGFDDPVEIIFLPRVLGHGGFAGGEIAISYLDRNYAGGGPEIVVHHEMVHILDQRLGGYRPSALAEGLAVYLSGGHFKQEPLLARAAALLPPKPGCVPAAKVLTGPQPTADAPVCSLGAMIDFHELIDRFYFTQHEIGYLEGGALVEFMVDEWGWEAFQKFYLSMELQPEPTEDQPQPGGAHWRALDAALRANFDITLPELEQRFYAALAQHTLSPQDVEDVRLTVAYYDSVRRYQQMLDPSAYFLTAWLVDTQAMFERGIVADYLRKPEAAENISLEELLVAADKALSAGDARRAERLLQIVNAALDVLAAPSAGEAGSQVR